MSALIYIPVKTAMQSGTGKTKKWCLKLDRGNDRFIDPIMGWTGSTNLEATEVKRYYMQILKVWSLRYWSQKSQRKLLSFMQIIISIVLLMRITQNNVRVYFKKNPAYLSYLVFYSSYKFCNSANCSGWTS